MRLNLNNKIHRFILLSIISITIFGVGFAVATLSQEKEPKPVQEDIEEKEEYLSPEEQKAEEHVGENILELGEMSEEEKERAKSQENNSDISKEELERSKQVAEKFAAAYGNYDARKPQEVVTSAKPYVNDKIYQQWKENPPRRPLALSKSTIKTLDTYPVDGGNKYEVAWNVVLVQETINTVGDKGLIEEWLWIVVEKQGDEWKVRGFDITNG